MVVSFVHSLLKHLVSVQCKKAIQAAIDEFKLGPRLSMFTEKYAIKSLLLGLLGL